MCNLESNHKNLKPSMGPVCKKEGSHGQCRRRNIQIMNAWKMTAQPNQWHFKHGNLPSFITASPWLWTSTYVAWSNLGSSGIFGSPFFYSWVGRGNNSEPKWLSMSTLLFCTMYPCFCNLSTSGMRIQLQKRITLVMLFKTTYSLHLKKTYFFRL